MNFDGCHRGLAVDRTAWLEICLHSNKHNYESNSSSDAKQSEALRRSAKRRLAIPRTKIRLHICGTLFNGFVSSNSSADSSIVLFHKVFAEGSGLRVRVSDRWVRG